MRICSQDKAFFLKRLDGHPADGKAFTAHSEKKEQHSFSLRWIVVGLIVNWSEPGEPKTHGESKSPGSFADICTGTTWPDKPTKLRICCWRLGWWQQALQSIMISCLFQCNSRGGSCVLVTGVGGCTILIHFVCFCALNQPFESSTSCVRNCKAPRDLAKLPEIWEVNLWTIWKTPASSPFPTFSSPVSCFVYPAFWEKPTAFEACRAFSS